MHSATFCTRYDLLNLTYEGVKRNAQLVNVLQTEFAQEAAKAASDFRRDCKAGKFTAASIHDAVNQRVQDKKTTLLSELRKQLPICHPDNTPRFLELVKEHYETFREIEMSQEKLWYFAISAMDLDTKLLWLERWNKPPKFRENQRFPKLGFSEQMYLNFLNKATWWSQVCIPTTFQSCLNRSLYPIVSALPSPSV